MSLFKREKAGPDGWSRWVTPAMGGYRMACCDCSLVHTLEFRVVDECGNTFVEFRARRNNISTALLRRSRRLKKP